jgi:hypothetical protein
LLSVAMAMACWTPLAIAGFLVPNASGIGTHHQLGLPPCTFVWLFGVRCPSCGMTTSWAHAVRGHFAQAVKSNAGGALLAMMAFALGCWFMISAVRGRWATPVPSDRQLAAVTTAVVLVTLIDWFYRLWGG